MEYVSDYYHYPADNFVQPDDVHRGTVSALTGLLPNPGEPTVSDWFIDGTMPTIRGQYTPPAEQTDCHDLICPPDKNGKKTNDGNGGINGGNNGGFNGDPNGFDRWLRPLI